MVTRRSHPGARGGGDPSCASIINLFFFTFLNLLVFFLFFQKVQIKKYFTFPLKTNMSPCFFCLEDDISFWHGPFFGEPFVRFPGGVTGFQGVSCLSITDPGDSDIIRSLPGQANWTSNLGWWKRDPSKALTSNGIKLGHGEDKSPPGGQIISATENTSFHQSSWEKSLFREI